MKLRERLPVYLLPLRLNAIAPTTVRSASGAVQQAADSPEESGLRTDVSSGRWHLDLVHALCHAWSVEGLEFMSQELCVLHPPEAALAGSAVEALLSRLEADGVPELASSPCPEWAAIREADFGEAIGAVVPCWDISDENGDVETFVEFLVAVQLAAAEAQPPNTGLLFFRPSQ